MRIFEVVLVVMNLFALLAGPRKKQSKAGLVTLAGMNLAVFGLHAAVEGVRYQMIFAYGIVFLFAIYVAMRLSFKARETKTFAKILKGTAIGLSVLFLALTTLMAYALPVFALPKPTGDYDVGVQYVYLTDDKRSEPFLKGSTDKRALAVKIYYPATKDKSMPRLAYFHDSPELIRAFTAGYSMPEFLFSHLRLVRSHVQGGLTLSGNQANYPVVLFSHGGGTTMEVHASQCEDLASHGYVVVAVNHTYVSSATELPGRIVTDRDATASFDKGDPLAAITQIMADDVSFVIDKLMDMNAGKSDSIFKGKLDMERIGVVGHSLGGAAAYNLAINDRRIKAAINLDGAVYLVPDKTKPTAPLLMLANDEFHTDLILNREPPMKKWDDMPAEEQNAVASAYGGKEGYMDIYREQEQAVVGLAETLIASDGLYTIDGSAHMNFTDIGLFVGNGFHRFIGINGKTSSERCLAITEAATVAFLDRYLNKETKDSLESVLDHYPHLRKVNLTEGEVHK